MTSPILHLGATVRCSHLGPATPLFPYPRVTVSGHPVVTVGATYGITGCGNSGSSPQCATGAFTDGAQRVRAGGTPVAIMAGHSTCVPTGNPLKPQSAQTRVTAS